MMRTPISQLILVAGLSLAMLAHVPAAMAEQPITTDSRIKTLVYNPNEVFPLVTHYGYQSNIEFGPKETIDMISVGDRVAWQISPAGRRLFIRAQEENAHTNMTVVTNLRAYQFDLRSSTADAVFGSEELTYVVRFFYPEEGGVMPIASYQSSPAPRPVASAAPVVSEKPVSPAPVATTAANDKPAPVAPKPAAAAAPVAVKSVQNEKPAPAPAPAPVAVAAAAPVSAPMPTGTIPAVIAQAPAPTYNYRYTYSGANTVAPVKIFDDGKSTYFKFAGAAAPQVAIITAKGEVIDVTTRVTPDGLIAVNAVAPRFSIRQGGQQVVVYNEAGGVL